MKNIYTDGQYSEYNQTWHLEDSPWKADQIQGIIARNDLRPRSVYEVGCGAGGVLNELAHRDASRYADVDFRGFDIAPQAIATANGLPSRRAAFVCGDMFALLEAGEFPRPELLLAIDVFEHVPDYLGFLAKCQAGADWKIYHIPLDVHVSAVVRDTFDVIRQGLGHIHSFTASSALASLRDTGHDIVDVTYTNGAAGLFRQHPSVRRAAANVPRWVLSRFSVPLTARLVGGYSLLVLAR